MSANTLNTVTIEQNPHFSAFLDTVGKELDAGLPEARFKPFLLAMFREIQVTNWEATDNGCFRLTLASAYEAKLQDRSGKTWILEKEIVMKFVSENRQILFPAVCDLKSAIESDDNILDPSNKNLNAIWATESYKHFWTTLYTGVGYSIRWDQATQKFISDNINDAPPFLQPLATPRIKSLEEVEKEWNDRDRTEIKL